MPTVNEAYALAAGWVNDRVASMPGFRGAFLHGSILSIPEGGVIPDGSDVDVVVVCDEIPPGRSGKVRCGSVLLDVSYVTAPELDPPEVVLGNHVLAGSLARGMLVADPTGWLRAIHRSIAPRFAEPAWIRKRCERAIVAACRNPTVRRRYEMAREVLADHGMDTVHEELLRRLGSDGMDAAMCASHWSAMMSAYDLAIRVPSPPPRYANHVSTDSRHAAVEGTGNALRSGLHREAMFWVANCFAKSVGILSCVPGGMDVPSGVLGFQPLLNDLGMGTLECRLDRRDEGLSALSRVREVAEAIIRDGEDRR